MRKKVLRTGMILTALVTVLLSGLCGCGRQTAEQPDHPDSSGQQEEAVLNEQVIQTIKERGYLRAGCKMDVPDLGYYDEETDTWSGLEVELAWQTAAGLFQVSVDEAKERGLVHFTGVTVADREEKLEQDEVDCLFATYTITKERKQKFAFSESYYTDYIGLMVKTTGTDANSLGTGDIRSIADLDGKKIGVAKNATTRKTFLNYIETMNNIKTNPVFFEYQGYQAMFQALKEGTIDVMAVDVSILGGYVDNTTTILGDRFGGQQYGAAVRRENAKLLDYINKAIRPEET